MRLKTTLAVLLFMMTSGVIHAQETVRERPVLTFKGNEVFSERELLNVAEPCLAANQGTDVSESDVLEYCLGKTTRFLRSKGYFQATLSQLKSESPGGLRHLVTVHEGPQFRLGRLEINGAKLLPPAQLRDMLELKTGDIVDGEQIFAWAYERVKTAYANLGYIQYSSDIEPTLTPPKEEPTGVVDLRVTIDEGREFTIRSISFEGKVDMTPETLQRLIFVRRGEVFNQGLLEESVKALSQTGLFAPIDANKDVEYRSEQDSSQLDLTIHLSKRAN